MEQKEKKVRDPNKMNVRDYITVAIIVVLMFLVYAIVGTPIGMSGIGNLFIFGVCGIVWGTFYLLYLSKVNKKNAVLVFGLIWAVCQLVNFWMITVVIALGAVIAEVIWRKLDRKKFTTMMICFTTQILFFFFGLSLPLMIMKDAYLSSIPEYASALYAEVFNYCMSPMFFAGIGVTIVGCIAGSFLGKLILKKHFAKAGII